MCGGGDKGDPELAKANALIEKSLKDDRKKADHTVKLLLLGAGESGKSTIAKQLRIIHQDGFDDDAKKGFIPLIHGNIITAINALIEGTKTLNIDTGDDIQDEIEKLEGTTLEGSMTSDVAAMVKKVWADAGIQKAYDERAQFQLSDSAKYYLDDIDRLTADGYLPNEQDVLRSRAKTTGIIETSFELDGFTFVVIDVGGQRSERRKWIHCFEDVTAILFCAALSGYNQKLYEDDKTNRLHESLDLFKSICSSRWFQNTSIILFLNKRDLFEEKILKHPLSVCFPEYDGEDAYDPAKDYIKDKFIDEEITAGKEVYTHFTCATDTGNIKVVFNAATDIILGQSMSGGMGV